MPRVFALDHFFLCLEKKRRATCHLKCVDFDHRNEKQKEHREERRARGERMLVHPASALCLHSSRSKINSRPHALVALCIFFCSFSLSLFSVSLRERPRLYIWRLKRLYYYRASPVDGKSHHSNLRRDRSEGPRTITHGAGNK